MLNVEINRYQVQKLSLLNLLFPEGYFFSWSFLFISHVSYSDSSTLCYHVTYLFVQ